jgi:hypothetical protein
VDPAYWHRGAFITAISLLNSVNAARERRRFGAAVAATRITQPPLFILGHWRSGTTHLHNLLAQDTAQFCFPNTFQVVNPQTFLTTEESYSRRFAGLVPPKRPMDNVAMSFQTPQEDEFAPAMISGRSLYLGISFPRRTAHYERFLTFRDAPVDAELWQEAFLAFARKLSYKHDGKPILYKSPPHTARIRLLLEMFPDARFVHIHREPFTVFQSFRHYYDTAMWHTYLQKPRLEEIDEIILRRYSVLFDAFFNDRPLIPPGRFTEVSFAQLEADPLRTVAGIYGALNLPGFASAEPALRRYVSGLSGYEKNNFGPLEPTLRARVSREWARSFDQWGYPG